MPLSPICPVMLWTKYTFQIVTMDQERLWLRLPLAMVPQETLPSKKTDEGILWDLWECPVVATAALLKRESHLPFLSGELVIFSLFDSKLSNAEKQEIAARLLTLQDLWQPGEMLIDIMTVPHSPLQPLVDLASFCNTRQF